MKRITIFCIFLLFITGCLFNNIDTSAPIPSPVLSYFDTQSSLQSLFDDMKAKGYSYNNSFDDISYYTDYPKSLTQYFNDRGGNCLDSTTWTAEYIKYKSATSYVADSFEIELMLSNRYVPRYWHYILRASIYGTLYEQSNTHLYRINSITEQRDAWYNTENQYRYFEVKERWVK